MIFPFDPLDPFPLLIPNSVSYALQKKHSEAADSYFGFRIQEVEKKLLALAVDKQKKSAQWIGLPPETLQTPYTELRWMLSVLHLRPGDKVVDLGAGYGRMGLVMQRHYPGCEFLGVEISNLRTEEGNRVFALEHASHAKILLGDAADSAFEIPDARVFFIYDLSVLQTIRSVLDRLKEIARRHPICVIGRGRATRDQIERHEPWLTQIVKPEQFINFTVYRSAEENKS